MISLMSYMQSGLFGERKGIQGDVQMCGTCSRLVLHCRVLPRYGDGKDCRLLCPVLTPIDGEKEHGRGYWLNFAFWRF